MSRNKNDNRNWTKGIGILFCLIWVYALTICTFASQEMLEARPTTISSLTSSGAGKFQVKWELIDGVDGYQIRFGTDPNFSKGSYKTASVEQGKTSHTRKDAERGAAYYVGVRTYILNREEAVYSAWSPTESVQVLEEDLEPVEEKTTQYFGKLKPLKMITVDYSEEALGGDYEFTYNEAGLVQEIKDIYGDTVFTYTFTYDTQGRMITKSAGLGMGMDSEVIIRREYDESDNLVWEDNNEYYSYDYDESSYSYVEGSSYPIGIGTDGNMVLFIKDASDRIIHGINLYYATNFYMDDEGYPTSSMNGRVVFTYDETDWVPSEPSVSNASSEMSGEEAQALLNKRPHEYTYSSGVGAWMTNLTINDDWTFTGVYHDSDNGDAGSQYPHGTVYICNFTGRFSEPVEIAPYIYQLTLESLECNEPEGKELFEEGFRYITTQPYGLEEGRDFSFYLPGMPLNSFSEEDYNWYARSVRPSATETTIPASIYLLHNNTTEATFVGDVSLSENMDGIPDPEEVFHVEAAEKKAVISEMSSCLYAAIYQGFWEEYSPSVEKDFWTVIAYYTDFEKDKDSSIYHTTASGTGRYMITQDKVEKAAYSIFPDFNGTFPALDGSVAIYDADTGEYGMLAGDFGVGMIEISDYLFNEDQTVVVTVQTYMFDENEDRNIFQVLLKETPGVGYGYQILTERPGTDQNFDSFKEQLADAGESEDLWPFAEEPVNSLSEEQLTDKLRTGTTSEIITTYCDDFDGDGSLELFAVVGQSGEGSLWFASPEIVTPLSLNGFAYYEDEREKVCTLKNGQKVLCMESGYGGSGSSSNCFYVSEGKPVAVAYAGEGLTHLSGDDFAVTPSAFDGTTDADTGAEMGGHTWKQYYVYWNGSGFDEYVGVEISKEALLQYSGAAEILQEAESRGYTVGTIYSRENGIINVNLYTQEESYHYNDNLTLHVDGNQVSLVKVYESDNWIWKYSYGGVYKAAGF